MKVFLACDYIWILFTPVHYYFLLFFLSFTFCSTRQMTSDYLLPVQITNRKEASNFWAAFSKLLIDTLEL